MCRNKNQSPIVLKIANPEVPKVNELVINEILYDPNTGGVDFVEIYNNSQKVFDLKSIKIANIDDSQQDIKSIDQSKLISPGDFIVLTSDNIDIKNRYTVKNPSNLVETKLPSFNDGAGNVSLLVTNPFGFQIIDSINYSDEMHAPLLNITSGVSLERINPNGQTSNRNNWHSAASTAGYGTPTYQNSQYFDLIPTKSDSTFSLPIVTFSPDGDGYNDYLTISIKTDKPDYQATIFVFDANGRLVKKLLDKQFISSADNIIWQGETDGDAAAPIGIYVLDCRLQHSDGTLKHDKLTCVLAKKLE
ncbi:MAG: lamin tail domain-containing protein [Saprospiraceae bacterium]|nr:lamin tail domain-containing protein [Saprospiraceae bacterium]